MKILDDIIAYLSRFGDSEVREVHVCIHWTAVVSRNCGLASTMEEEGHNRHVPVRGVGNLAQKTALELAEYAKSDNLLEASIGMAAVNSLIDIEESRCTQENAFEVLASKAKGKNLAVVGYYPWVPKLQELAKNLWVIEKRPKQGTLPAEAAEDILPRANVVAITGTSLINHTLDGLLELCKSSYVVMVGPTSPLLPVLFDYGVDVIGGARVVEPETVVRHVSQGAVFTQVRGVELVTMMK